MQTYKVPHTELAVSRIAYGCASLAPWDRALRGEDVSKAAQAVHVACERGITLFDLADVYAFGRAERVFGSILKASPALRERIVIQTKCGQILPEGWTPGTPIGVDLSYQHILDSVEDSLKRLGIEHLDILLLHTPDALMSPQEIAAAFDKLERNGTVRYFGVSNFSASQLSLLQGAMSRPLVVNQVRIGVAHPGLIAEGMDFALALTRGTSEPQGGSAQHAGLLDFCRTNAIQVQAWSPLRGALDSHNKALWQLDRIARAHGATPAQVALAWLLNHPARIVPLIGTARPEHIIEQCEAEKIVLSREQWYSIFAASDA